jgi:hypothetical protein
MITIGAKGQQIAYGIKHYNLDDESDLETLKTRPEEVMGSTCFVISTSKYYMYNSIKQWVEITPYGQVVSSGGTGATDEVIYEGGVI